MSIDKINPEFSKITSITGNWEKTELKPERPNGVKSFSEIFESSIKEVQSLEAEAEKQIEGLVTGQPGITSHGAMIAMERADTTFQLMNTIRTKLIRVYEEVMRTAI